jgi:hypothetical protein
MMKSNYKRVPTTFGPETRFALRPAPAAPFRATQASKLELLKDELLRQTLQQAVDAELNSQLRRAANEAAALAWVTPFPLLVFPALFDEKVATALAQVERQVSIRQRTRELVMV